MHFITHLLRQIPIGSQVQGEILLPFEGIEGGKLEVATIMLSHRQGRSRAEEMLKEAK